MVEGSRPVSQVGRICRAPVCRSVWPAQESGDFILHSRPGSEPGLLRACWEGPAAPGCLTATGTGEHPCWSYSHRPRCVATVRPSGLSGPVALTWALSSAQAVLPAGPTCLGRLVVDIAPAAGHWPVSPCVRLGEGRGPGRFLLAGSRGPDSPGREAVRPSGLRRPQPGSLTAPRSQGPRWGPASVSVQHPGHPVWGRGA